MGFGLLPLRDHHRLASLQAAECCRHDQAGGCTACSRHAGQHGTHPALFFALSCMTFPSLHTRTISLLLSGEQPCTWSTLELFAADCAPARCVCAPIAQSSLVFVCAGVLLVQQAAAHCAFGSAGVHVAGGACMRISVGHAVHHATL